MEDTLRPIRHRILDCNGSDGALDGALQGIKVSSGTLIRRIIEDFGGANS